MGQKGGAMTLIRNFLKDESGVTAIEYSLIAALLSLVSIVVLQDNNPIGTIFERFGNDLITSGAAGPAES